MGPLWESRERVLLSAQPDAASKPKFGHSKKVQFNNFFNAKNKVVSQCSPQIMSLSDLSVTTGMRKVRPLLLLLNPLLIDLHSKTEQRPLVVTWPSPYLLLSTLHDSALRSWKVLFFYALLPFN